MFGVIIHHIWKVQTWEMLIYAITQFLAWVIFLLGHIILPGWPKIEVSFHDAESTLSDTAVVI